MSTDICKDFGRRIRQLREEKHLRQVDLAEKVGIEHAHLSRIENGVKEPCLRVVQMLAAGLDVSLRKIFWDL
jgi:transcriptional regulator with XRE-family HTH domain